MSSTRTFYRVSVSVNAFCLFVWLTLAVLLAMAFVLKNIMLMRVQNQVISQVLIVLFVAVSCVVIFSSQGGVQSKAQTDGEEGRTEESFDGK